MLIELHGWDAVAQQWHTPALIDHKFDRKDPIARRLRNWSGAWHGRMQASVPGEPRIDFSASVHDLGDCGVGMLDLDGSDGGPLHFVLAVPGDRRSLVRPELGFEFVSFMRFLEGATPRNPDMALLDYIEGVLKAPQAEHLVFSVEGSPQIPEMQLLVSQQAERLAMGMVDALHGRAASLAAAAD